MQLTKGRKQTSLYSLNERSNETAARCLKGKPVLVTLLHPFHRTESKVRPFVALLIQKIFLPNESPIGTVQLRVKHTYVVGFVLKHAGTFNFIYNERSRWNLILWPHCCSKGRRGFNFLSKRILYVSTYRTRKIAALFTLLFKTKHANAYACVVCRNRKNFHVLGSIKFYRILASCIVISIYIYCLF